MLVPPNLSIFLFLLIIDKGYGGNKIRIYIKEKVPVCLFPGPFFLI